MRILLLNYEYPPLGGGAGVVTAALAASLAGRREHVDVVTAATWPGEGGLPREARGVEHPTTPLLVNDPSDPPLAAPRLFRVRTRRRGVHDAGMGGAAGYLRAALPVVRDLVRRTRYDIVHFFFSLPTGALLPLCDFGRAPVVVSLRGSDVPGYDESDLRLRVAHRLALPLTRWIWRRADRIVMLSEGLGRLAWRTSPDLRFTVIRNGVDLELFHPGAAVPPAPGAPLRCLAVARLIERKGIANLLRALSLLERDRFTLDVVGSGPAEGALRSLASKLELGGGVRFVGALDRPALAARYRQADVFTLSPREEAFGNVFAEALASGLPIVGSDVGGIPEFVPAGEAGFLVSPEDPAALAAALRRMANDAGLRARMGAANRERAVATLSWEHMTDRYLQVYRALRRRLAGARPGPDLS
ncbi:MAG: glycosyltransferase family 4 protein [Gemmatimonadetes bacterium]|nr:glycosyltransferase family 4 protein [Gemmatimonadota bacterium]